MNGQNQRKRRKLPLYVVVLVAVAFFATAVLAGLDFILPYTHDDLAVGDVSPVHFRAHIQVENIYRTSLAREEAAAAVETQFQYDPAVTESVLADFEGFFADAGALRSEFMPILRPFEQMYEHEEDRPLPDTSRLNINLTDQQFRYLITGGSPTFAAFYTALMDLAEVELSENRTSVAEVEAGLRNQGFDEVFVEIGGIVATQFLRTNMVVNEVETERLRQVARDEADIIWYRAGETIILQGSIIQEEHYLVLVELGYIGISAEVILTGLAGSLLTVTLVFLVSLVYIRMFMGDIVFNKKRAMLLFALYMMVIILMRLMVFLPFYFTPILLFAMLVSILIDMRLSAVLTVGVSIIAVVMNPMDAMFVTYAIINGIFAAMIAQRIVVRRNMLLAAGVFILVNAITVFANYFLFAGGFGEYSLNAALFAMIGGVMTITLAYGSLPLWEGLFGVVTQNTLLELTDPNNALLRRLLIETPGTYHHALVVANLSEAACYDIGANHVLARVGAYYHDIGKMRYPHYFAENQTDFNPHDSMEPLESVEVLNSHITNGMEMAKEYKLPTIVSDFIYEHHGTSIMGFFYSKAQKDSLILKVDDKDYRYKNRIPQTPETAVVMLADTCEAAVRSVFGKGDKPVEEMEAFVKRLIKDKLDDGQLDDSSLTLKDLNTITKAFMRVFKGMHHERVPYPTKKG
ncbi:MAG: HDIG domain-containing protein [Defluviitaleaceae bacterium]|nr:HDIG domain-containing protein [Defluviitaleaceae bacterium]